MKKLEDFRGHELIKTNKIFFLLDYTLSDCGWPLPVYFDRKSDLFRVIDTTSHGVYYETSELPPNGPFEFEVPEPVQFAKGIHLTTIKVIVKDV